MYLSSRTIAVECRCRQTWITAVAWVGTWRSINNETNTCSNKIKSATKMCKIWHQFSIYVCPEIFSIFIFLFLFSQLYQLNSVCEISCIIAAAKQKVHFIFKAEKVYPTNTLHTPTNTNYSQNRMHSLHAAQWFATHDTTIFFDRNFDFLNKE